MKVKTIKRLRLFGFNNLTKVLSFNMYLLCKRPGQQRGYIEYIGEQYNADKLTQSSVL